MTNSRCSSMSAGFADRSEKQSRQEQATFYAATSFSTGRDRQWAGWRGSGCVSFRRSWGKTIVIRSATLVSEMTQPQGFLLTMMPKWALGQFITMSAICQDYQQNLQERWLLNSGTVRVTRGETTPSRKTSFRTSYWSGWDPKRGWKRVDILVLIVNPAPCAVGRSVCERGSTRLDFQGNVPSPASKEEHPKRAPVFEHA